MPNQTERHEIWKASIPAKTTLEKDIDIISIAGRYELSSASIVNVIHAPLQTIHKSSVIISKQDIMEGMKREYEKEERVFNG